MTKLRANYQEWSEVVVQFVAHVIIYVQDVSALLTNCLHSIDYWYSHFVENISKQSLNPLLNYNILWMLGTLYRLFPLLWVLSTKSIFSPSNIVLPWVERKTKPARLASIISACWRMFTKMQSKLVQYVCTYVFRSAGVTVKQCMYGICLYPTAYVLMLHALTWWYSLKAKMRLSRC